MELTAEAIHKTGRLVSSRIKEELANIEDPGEAIQLFIRSIADHVEASGFSSGGPLMIVAMETATSSERLNTTCREAYSLLQGAFEEKLIASGYSETQAVQLASFITASIEGGIILSRVHHSGDPLRNVADKLRQLLKVFPKE